MHKHIIIIIYNHIYITIDNLIFIGPRSGLTLKKDTITLYIVYQKRRNFDCYITLYKYNNVIGVISNRERR